MVFLAGAGHTTNLLRRTFLPRFTSWRLMKHREFREVINCGCFPSSQPSGGSSSTHSDRGSPLTPFPPAWTLDFTTVWKAPYSRTLQGRQEVLLCQSRQGLEGCLAASRPRSRSLKGAENTPRAGEHHQITHLLISIPRGHQLCSVLGGEQSPVGASDLPLQEKKPLRSTRALNSSQF